MTDIKEGITPVSFLARATNFLRETPLAPFQMSLEELFQELNTLRGLISENYNWVGWEAYRRALEDGYVLVIPLKGVRVIPKKKHDGKPLLPDIPTSWVFAEIPSAVEYATFIIIHSILGYITDQPLNSPVNTEMQNTLRFKISDAVLDTIKTESEEAKYKVKMNLWKDYRGRHGLSLELLGVA